MRRLVAWVIVNVFAATLAVAHANISAEALQAEFALKRGDKRQSVDLWYKTIERQADVQAYPYVLTLALEVQDYARAASVAATWHAAAPESIDALYYMAHVALKTEKIDTAFKALTNLLSQRPASNLQRLMRGVDLTNRDYVKQLLKQLEPLQRIAPNNRSVQMLLVQLYVSDEQFAPAGTMLDKLLLLPGPSSEMLFAKYLQLLQTQGYSESLTWLIKQSPDQRVLESMVRNLIHEGGYRQLLQLVQHWPFAIQPTGNIWREYMHSALILGYADLATEAMLKMTDDFETADEGYYYLGKLAQLQDDAARVDYFFNKVKFDHWEDKRIAAQAEFMLAKKQYAEAEALITPYLSHKDVAKRYMAVAMYMLLLDKQNKDPELKKWLQLQLEQEQLEYLGVIYRYIPTRMGGLRDKYADVLSEQHPEVLFAHIQRTLKASNANKYLSAMETLQSSGVDPLTFWLTKAQIYALQDNQAQACDALNRAADQAHEWLLSEANVRRWQQWCLPKPPKKT